MIETIREILSNYIDDVSEVTEESALSADIGLSSMDMVMVVGEIEDEYGVKMSDEDFAKIQTVGDIVECLKEKLGQEV